MTKRWGAALFASNPGGWECVGRIFIAQFQDGEHPVFEHQHTISQRHILTESPGGYDYELLGYLIAQEINIMIDVEEEAGKLVHRWAPRDKVINKGVELFQAGRRRFFLPFRHWERFIPEYESPPPSLPRINLYLQHAEPLFEALGRDPEILHEMIGEPDGEES